MNTKQHQQQKKKQKRRNEHRLLQVLLDVRYIDQIQELEVFLRESFDLGSHMVYNSWIIVKLSSKEIHVIKLRKYFS